VVGVLSSPPFTGTKIAPISGFSYFYQWGQNRTETEKCGSTAHTKINYGNGRSVFLHINHCGLETAINK